MAVFLNGDSKLMASAVRTPMISILLPTFFEKEPGHISAVVHARMTDKTYPVQVSFSDSLWARIRCSHTNVGPRITKVRTRKLKYLFYFDLTMSGLGSRTICTVTKFEHQCDVITFQPYTVM